MTSLVVAPIPLPHATAGAGDWWVAIAATILFVAAVIVAMVINNRPAKVKPAIKETPVETLRKAA
jgi:hypothetical protein